jgi:ADP-heptose:LPS heptosyltransferase
VHRPVWRRDEHEVLRWCRLVGSVGASCGPDDLRVPELPAARGGSEGPVVVHPGAASRSRRWPPERFAEVARSLRAAGREVVVTGGAAERDLADEVVRRAGLPRSASTAGALDLPALADLVAGASLLVCGDTGVAHLATAVGTPSVLLFGPVAPSLWGPAVDHDRHVVLWHGDGTGDPHGAEPDPALLRVTVDEVLEAVTRLTTVALGN